MLSKLWSLVFILLSLAGGVFVDKVPFVES